MAGASTPQLDQLDRRALVDSTGRTFAELRRTLDPRYVRAWIDIALGYGALGVVFVTTLYLDRRHPAALPATATGAAILVGYTLHYLHLFFHEAAHYLLHSSRTWNDRLANSFLGLFVGQDIQFYRVVHFDHHRNLGTPEDTERSYFNALKPRFIVEALTGILILRVVIRRIRHVDAEKPQAARPGVGRRRAMLVGGLAFNLSVMGGAAWAGAYSFALAWPVSTFVIFPAINGIRQLLEHRSYDASSSVDYAKVPHGAVTRIFGSGPIASTLGGAGFNRHLLHHFEPQISYTRFRELEAFLLDTAAAGALKANTSTYARTFARLLRAD